MLRLVIVREMASLVKNPASGTPCNNNKNYCFFSLYFVTADSLTKEDI